MNWFYDLELNYKKGGGKENEKAIIGFDPGARCLQFGCPTDLCRRTFIGRVETGL
jgi:hypothetical protein